VTGFGAVDYVGTFVEATGLLIGEIFVGRHVFELGEDGLALRLVRFMIEVCVCVDVIDVDDLGSV
jgi:hypothetical protein